MLNSYTTRLSSYQWPKFTQYILLAGITLLALALRLYKLGAFSFWYDEVITVNATRYLSEWPVLRLPINLVLIREAMALFNQSEWSARLAPALIGVISLPLLFFPIRRMFNTRIALITLLLLAVSPWHLYWSQNARFYTLLLLLYTLGLLLYFIGTEHGKLWVVLVSVLFLLFTIREKMSGFFFVFVIPAYWVLAMYLSDKKSKVLNWKFVVLLFAPAVLFGFYDLYRVLLLGLPSMIIEFFEVFAGTPNHSPVRFLLSVIYRIGLPMFILGIFGGMYLIYQRSRAGLFASLGAVIPVALLFVLSTILFTLDRYVFITLPFWAMLCAAAIEALIARSQGAAKFLAVGVFLLVTAVSLSDAVLYYEYQNGSRPDWRSAFTLVEQNRRAGDRVLSTIPLMGQYYLDDAVE